MRNPSRTPSGGQFHFIGSEPQSQACPPLDWTQRHRLSWWADQGLLPQGVKPATIAAAYARATGCPPARDPEKKATRSYSGPELLQAFGQLIPAPPPEPKAWEAPPPAPKPPADGLAEIWQRGLMALELPSARMLLNHQAQLLSLSPSFYRLAGPDELVALIRVTDNWLPMVRSRRDYLSRALGKTLGCPVCIACIPAGGEL